MFVTSSSSVFVRPGRTGKVGVSFDSALEGVDAFVLVLAFDAPGDPTPGQMVSAIARLRR